MALTYQPYNITLPSFSPVLNYSPWRDGLATEGWNSSFTESTVASLSDALGGFNFGSGIAFRTTEFSGAAVSVDFEGTAVYLCLTASDASVTYTLLVDDQTIPWNGIDVATHPDPACSIYGGQPQEIVYATNLTYGNHTAVLQTAIPSSGTSLNFYGATVTISAGEPGPKRVEVVDDGDMGWDYTPVAAWIIETDDEHFWNGDYHATADYSPQATATYTFQGASAIILRGLSMFNYAGYNITLDNDSGSVFNATDYYWRHSPAVLYFAGGLDPTQSHTITLTNYDAAQPNPPTNHPGGLLYAALDTLSLVMDDISSRDALLASVGVSTSALQSNTLASSTISSSLPAGSIAAIVLGICLLLLLGFNGVLLYNWRRKAPYAQSRVYREKSRVNSIVETFIVPDASRATPWTPTAAIAPLPPVAPSQTVASSMPNRAPAFSISSTSSSTSRTPSMQSRQRAEKGMRVSANEIGQRVAKPSDRQIAEQRSGTRSETSSISRPKTPQTGSLRELSDSFSRFMRGQLREEFMEREGIEPPEYSDDLVSNREQP